MPLEKPDSARASLLSRARQAFRGVEQGAPIIARHAKTAPTGPGVYRMIDAAGEVLYVGKARSLKKRVQSYARTGSHNNRIARMVADTASMEFVTTATEIEALLLEANLIKRLKPRYNVVLRDDKSFPFILITRDHGFPQILKHRGARSGKGDYFGPFASAGAVGRTINTLQRAFLLRSCSDAYFEGRVRPCLLFQIKRCSAPCTGEISEAEYANLVDEARRFLTGESDEVKRRLHKLMDDASLKQDYERAASFRDRMTALSHVQSHQGINPHTVREADVFAAHQEAGHTAIQVFFFRTGNNWGNRAYFPRADKSLAVEEVLESFVAQFYDDKPPPKLVLLSHDIAGRRLLGDGCAGDDQSFDARRARSARRYPCRRQHPHGHFLRRNDQEGRRRRYQHEVWPRACNPDRRKLASAERLICPSVPRDGPALGLGRGVLQGRRELGRREVWEPLRDRDNKITFLRTGGNQPGNLICDWRCVNHCLLPS